MIYPLPRFQLGKELVNSASIHPVYIASLLHARRGRVGYELPLLLLRSVLHTVVAADIPGKEGDGLMMVEGSV